MNAFVNQYQSNQVLTASPEQILIMLYDGAIRFVRQARQGIEAGDKGAKAMAVSKAIAIISEFSNTLNYDTGGEIAIDLNSLYHFMIRELTSVNVHGDGTKLDPVENILVELRGAWVEAAQIYTREKQGSGESEGLRAGVAAAL